MGIFGGEKYSKEGYEEAEKQRVIFSGSIERLHILTSRCPEFLKFYNEFAEIGIEVGEKARELYAQGQAEAAALNEEYGRLLARAQESLKAVADFEREKLGMHKESAEEADADKK